MTSNERFDVVNGPSRWDLMLSLFSAEPHLVTFEALIPSPVRLTVSVCSVSGPDEDCDWVILAHVIEVENLSSNELNEVKPKQEEPTVHRVVRICTNTEGNRHGCLFFIPPGETAFEVVARCEESE